MLKHTLILALPSYFLNVDTIKFQIIYVAVILILLDSAVLKKQDWESHVF